MNDVIARHRQTLERFPDNELARFSLGKALFDAGEIEEARQHLQIALVRKPDWMVVQILLGKCALAQGDIVAARAAFRRALELAIAQNHDGPREEMEQVLAGFK